MLRSLLFGEIVHVDDCKGYAGFRQPEYKQ